MRAADFTDAFRDPLVAGVISAVGGSTSRELLSRLDPNLIRNNPKAFIGRSDNTFLNAFLLHRAGLTSYNGVAFLTQFGAPHLPQETATSTVSVLLGSEDVQYQSSRMHTVGLRLWDHYERFEGNPPEQTFQRSDRWLRPGWARGRLVGGEIRIVADLLELDLLDFDDAILWLDIGDDSPNWFDEHLRRIVESCGSAQPCGVMVSHNPWRQEDEWVQQVELALRMVSLREGAPVFIGGDIGHYQPAWLLPYGCEIVMDSAHGVKWPRP